MLIQHLFVAIPAFLVATSIYSLGKRRASNTPTTFGVLLVGLAMLCFGVPRLVWQYQELSFLRNLSLNHIDFITVGERQFSDSDALQKVVTALNASEWFSPHNGSTSDKSVELVIHLRAGDVHRYAVSKYIPGPAAVVKFDSGSALIPGLDYAVSLLLPRSISL